MPDRIDIKIDVPRVDSDKLSSDRIGELASLIFARVQAARQRQLMRFKGTDIVGPCENRNYCNADMRISNVRKFASCRNPGNCKLDETGDSLISAARFVTKIQNSPFPFSKL